MQPQRGEAQSSPPGTAHLEGHPRPACAAAGQQGLSTGRSSEWLPRDKLSRTPGASAAGTQFLQSVPQQRQSPTDHGTGARAGVLDGLACWAERPSQAPSPASAQEEQNVTAAQETCF